MPSISITRLTESGIPRVGEIDRTERVRVGYRVEDGQLIRVALVWDSSPWRREEEGEHSIPRMVHDLEEIISHEGVMLGDSTPIGWLEFPHSSPASRRRPHSRRFCT